MHFTDHPPDCGDFGVVRNARSKYDGIKQWDVDTILGCKERCYHILNETCLGFTIKFINGGGCYLHVDQMKFWHVHLKPDFEFYYLTPPCEGNLPIWSNLTWWFPRHLSRVLARVFTDRAIHTCACRTISSGGRGLSSICLPSLLCNGLVFLSCLPRRCRSCWSAFLSVVLLMHIRRLYCVCNTVVWSTRYNNSEICDTILVHGKTALHPSNSPHPINAWNLTIVSVR